MTQGIILAAGRGSRMRAQTEDKPKCRVGIAGQTLLDWQLAALRAAGLANVLVVRGYLAERLQGDFDTVDNPRWSQSNMVVTLTCAAERLAQGPCVVSYSDIVYRAEHVQKLLAAEGDIRITYDLDWEALWSLRFPDPLADAETFDAPGGRLREIGNRPTSRADIKGQYMGLLYFSPQGWDVVREHLDSLPEAELDRLDMTALLKRLLAQDVAITAVPVRGGWCEVDSESDLAAYQDALSRADASGRAWTHDFRTDGETR